MLGRPRDSQNYLRQLMVFHSGVMDINLYYCTTDYRFSDLMCFQLILSWGLLMYLEDFSRSLVSTHKCPQVPKSVFSYVFSNTFSFKMWLAFKSYTS